MRFLLHILSIATLLLLNFQLLLAQERKYSSTSKKAIDRFEKAIAAFDARQDDEAEMYLQKAIDADPNFIEAYTVLGDMYSNKRKSEKAIENYKKALAIDPLFFPNNYNSLGEEQLKLSLYTEAKENFNKFLKTEIKNLQTKNTWCI
jgi:tetratricopeptide (TPR) repeat protein